MEQISIPRPPRPLPAIAAALVLSVTPVLAQEAAAPQIAPPPVRADAASRKPNVPASHVDAGKSALAQGAVPEAAVPAKPAAASPGPSPDANTIDLTMAGVAGLLAAFGVAGMGAVAISLRRQRRRPDAHDTEEMPTDLADPNPAGLPPFVPERRVLPRIARGSGGAAPGGGVVPGDPGERDALIERMVAAPPDADNPFTTAKGRRRRARLLLAKRQSEMERTDGSDWRRRTLAPETATREMADV